jgi:hypothetical protein
MHRNSVVKIPSEFDPDALLSQLDGLDPRSLARLDALLAESSYPIWLPNPGPQREALESPADILLYGGAAGGGKSDLLLGAAATRHRRSIIFRRDYAQLKSLRERATELFGATGRFHAQQERWRLSDGRSLWFGAVQHEGDKQKFQGQPHDLKGFDEITHFTESQFRFIIGWNRSTDPAQRCRVICAGNPPVTAEGDWVIRYWASWLDPTHPTPAEPGELRWFATVGGRDVECPDGTPFDHQGETIRPVSRSFIRASVEDNPDLMESGYRATLQSLPEPLRAQMLNGNFSAGQEDDPWQIIPTGWILAAQARWHEKPPGPIDTLGVDVARGGRDRTVLSPRHGNWFGRQALYPGTATPDGPSVVGLIIGAIGDQRPAIQFDVIGIGAAVEDIGRQQGLHMVPLNFAAASAARDRSGQLGFLNARAEHYWKLREALDPATGDGLALPPDRELLADLAASRWRVSARGIQIEAKTEIAKRIGRSPDKGDALVYAHALPTTPAAGWLDYYRDLAG